VTIDSFLTTVSSDANLQLALIAMFFLIASLMGGIGCVIAFAFSSLQMIRFCIMLGMFSGAASYLI